MKFGDFFDLVRQHDEVGGEAKRHGDLRDVCWESLPTRWLLMANEHFAVMIYVWNTTNKDAKPEFWIEMKQKVYTVLMKRLMPMREAQDAGRDHEAA